MLQALDATHEPEGLAFTYSPTRIEATVPRAARWWPSSQKPNNRYGNHQWPGSTWGGGQPAGVFPGWCGATAVGVAAGSSGLDSVAMARGTHRRAIVAMALGRSDASQVGVRGMALLATPR